MTKAERVRGTVTEQKRLAVNEQVRRDALLDALEYDSTGQMKDSTLTFDQRVQYSIARSLKQLCDHMDDIREEKRR